MFASVYYIHNINCADIRQHLVAISRDLTIYRQIIN